jgi:hypothetical protein
MGGGGETIWVDYGSPGDGGGEKRRWSFSTEGIHEHAGGDGAGRQAAV